MPDPRRHPAVIAALLLLVAILVVKAWVEGFDVFMGETKALLAFLNEQAVTLLFLALVASLVTWILKLHFSNDDDYKNFKLQKLLVNEKGEPDPKRISLWLAQLAGLYAFFFLLHRDVHAFTSYANWFLLTLMGYHGANEIFKRPGGDRDDAPPK